MVSPRLMHRGAADLDHIEPRRRFKNPVPDPRWLQDAVSRLHQEWRALVLVDHAHPSRLAEDHLKAHAMIVHIVRHLATRGNLDVRSDKASAQATGNQVAILHAGAASIPVRHTGP